MTKELCISTLCNILSSHIFAGETLRIKLGLVNFAAMDGKSIFFYSWIIFGIAMALLFIKLAIPKIKDVRALNDPWAWITDSRMSHKLAELMIWIPFYFIILWSLYEATGEVAQFIDKTEWLMIIGGILAAYSFFDARGKYWWAYAMWGMMIWGLFGPWFGRTYVLPYLSAW